MALPSSGEISFANINTELGRSSTAQIGINEAEAGTYATINQASAQKPNGSTPNAINEWYSYDHSAASNIFTVSLGTSNVGACAGLIRIVKSTNNATGLAGAVGYALYREPQNTLITGYTHVAEWDGVEETTTTPNYNLNSTTGVVGSSTGYTC